jgi:hypothetical protein
MQELWLAGKVLPVGARLMVRHTFRSDEKHPLEFIYAFGLPRDAALRRFRVTGEGFSVRSELKSVEEAEKTYEKAIEKGHLATRWAFSACFKRSPTKKRPQVRALYRPVS